MIWKYDTKRIEGVDYICTSRLISEKGKPDFILERECAFTKELVDVNRKLQWAMESNPEYNTGFDAGPDNLPHIIVHRPQALTIEEIAKKKDELYLQKVAQVISYPELLLLLMDLLDNKPGVWDKIKEIKKQVGGL